MTAVLAIRHPEFIVVAADSKMTGNAAPVLARNQRKIGVTNNVAWAYSGRPHSIPGLGFYLDELAANFCCVTGSILERTYLCGAAMLPVISRFVHQVRLSDPSFFPKVDEGHYWYATELLLAGFDDCGPRICKANVRLGPGSDISLEVKDVIHGTRWLAAGRGDAVEQAVMSFRFDGTRPSAVELGVTAIRQAIATYPDVTGPPIGVVQIDVSGTTFDWFDN